MFIFLNEYNTQLNAGNESVAGVAVAVAASA